MSMVVQPGKWWPVELAVALGLSPTAAAPATLTVSMRLAEAEWRVIHQEVLPPFEQACGCCVRAMSLAGAGR